MRGAGQARAAISLVNALPLGIGAAVGIGWPASATSTVRPGPAARIPAAVSPRRAGTPVVRVAAELSVARYAPSSRPTVRLAVRSSIPLARGLKSSSAVASSVTLATARALGADPSARETAELAAEAGRRSGVSATGAFDDALAGLVPGAVVTNNRQDAELRRFPLDRGLRVALWIPQRRHPPSPSVRRRFQRHPRLAHGAVDAALAGDWRRAMTINTALVELAMGYRYEGLHRALATAGALASGVSGLGPTVAAVVPAERLRYVLRAMPGRAGRRRSVSLADRALAPGGSAT